MTHPGRQIQSEIWFDDESDTLTIYAACPSPDSVTLTTIDKHGRQSCKLVKAADKPKAARPMFAAETGKAEIRICSSCLERIPFALNGNRTSPPARFCPHCGTLFKLTDLDHRRHVT